MSLPKLATIQNPISETTKKEKIMTQIVHYFVLIFIVIVCAEISNVLLYENPYQTKPVSIWNETAQNVLPVIRPAIKL